MSDKNLRLRWAWRCYAILLVLVGGALLAGGIVLLDLQSLQGLPPSELWSVQSPDRLSGFLEEKLVVIDQALLS